MTRIMTVFISLEREFLLPSQKKTGHVFSSRRSLLIIISCTIKQPQVQRLGLKIEAPAFAVVSASARAEFAAVLPHLRPRQFAIDRSLSQVALLFHFIPPPAQPCSPSL